MRIASRWVAKWPVASRDAIAHEPGHVLTQHARGCRFRSTFKPPQQTGLTPVNDMCDASDYTCGFALTWLTMLSTAEHGLANDMIASNRNLELPRRPQ